MGILAWILFGLIVGVIAKFLVPSGPGGIIGDIIVGILGAVIGGWVYSIVGHVGVTGFNIGSFICAVLGAVILLLILRALSGRPTVA